LISFNKTVYERQVNDSFILPKGMDISIYFCRFFSEKEEKKHNSASKINEKSSEIVFRHK
jgi:hypothetical protein